MSKILVMCHGNINRSALCAGLLKTLTTHDIKSAGFVNPGRRAAKKMRDAAEGYHVDLSEHRSQLITDELVSWANHVILMDGGNLRRWNHFVERYHRTMIPTAHMLANYDTDEPKATRIPDPAFQKRDSLEFDRTVDLIVRCTHNFAKVMA